MSDAWVLGILGGLWGALVLLIGVAWSQQGKRVDEMKRDFSEKFSSVDERINARVSIPFCTLKHDQQSRTMERVEGKLEETSQTVQEIRLGLAEAGIIKGKPKEE